MVLRKDENLNFDIKRFCKYNESFEFSDTVDNSSVNIIKFNSKEEWEEFYSNFNERSLSQASINDLCDGISMLRIVNKGNWISFTTGSHAYDNCNIYNYSDLPSAFPTGDALIYTNLMI